jgi:dUTP pyrophosphatase
MLAVKLKKDKDAKEPAYATDGSGAFDIFATDVKRIADNVYEYNTGLYFEIPKDYVLLVFSRSSQGFKYQTSLSNGTGVIDSDYRGELKIQLISHITLLQDGEDFIKQNPYDLSKAIAQGIIIQRPQIQWQIVDSLSETTRGSGGFGSTNK